MGRRCRYRPSQPSMLRGGNDGGDGILWQGRGRSATEHARWSGSWPQNEPAAIVGWGLVAGGMVQSEWQRVKM
eukprot:4077688-Pleurochrysis_carterae.AAC.3